MANIEKLGSSSPEVLLKNATNLDKLVNGRESESLPDRFGVLRKTWHGMEMIFNRFIDYITGRGEQAVAAIGWQELGNWAVGLAVDNRQQIVYYNGSWYKYLGELEHVIAGDSPENDGGVWSAANPTGKWSNIGDAALRSNLGSDEADLGGALVSIDNATVRELAENNIFRKMTRADINTMLNTPGAEVDVEYALQALQDEGHTSIVFPHDVKGIYTLAGNVTVTATLIAYTPCAKPYTISGDSSFLNKGAVIRKAAGADYIFGPGTVPRFYGLLLDGRDKSRPLFNHLNQSRGGILFNCGIYRFLYGVGSYSYTSIQVWKSSICANTIGIRNLIDSRVIDVTINTQSSHAVDLQTGANNNLFQNVRNEWNDGVGYNISGSVGNIITGELVDRNGSANFAITNGGGAIVGNLFSQRPGRTSGAGAKYNSHFYIEGANSYLMVSNVKTRTGVDDDGGGNLTPERVITMGGGSTDFTVQFDNCDLTGELLAP